MIWNQSIGILKLYILINLTEKIVRNMMLRFLCVSTYLKDFRKKLKSVPNGLIFYSCTNLRMRNPKIKSKYFFDFIFDFFRFLKKVPLK
jgi:hypothetical protein